MTAKDRGPGEQELSEAADDLKPDGRGVDLILPVGSVILPPSIPAPGETAAWITSHPLRWSTWHDGWERGYVQGYSDGDRAGALRAGQEWTDVTSAACRVGLQLQKWADAERHRRAAAARPGPRDTPQQIREQAHASWAAVEAAIQQRRRTA